MATYHFSVKFGAKGRGAAHADYITREGKYQHRGDLVHVEHGNMPAWAKEEPQHFWQAADQFERKNGSAYREFEIALPRELNSEQQIGLVREFVSRELGERHAYTLAIHNPTASIDGGEQPHAHVMMSLRVNDGIDREPDQYFKRFNAKYPERGGARKDSGHSLTLTEQREALVDLRERWADTHNRYVENVGIEQARIDHRSLADQGIARLPEYHLGFEASGRLTELDKLTIIEGRNEPDTDKWINEQLVYFDINEPEIRLQYRQVVLSSLEKAIAENGQLSVSLAREPENNIQSNRANQMEKTKELERGGFEYGD